MLKKLTGKNITMIKKNLRERTAADYCAIMCYGRCFEPILLKYDMTADMRLDP